MINEQTHAHYLYLLESIEKFQLDALLKSFPWVFVVNVYSSQHDSMEAARMDSYDRFCRLAEFQQRYPGRAVFVPQFSASPVPIRNSQGCMLMEDEEITLLFKIECPELIDSYEGYHGV